MRRKRKRGTKGNSKVFDLRIQRMGLLFTETEQLWKRIIFGTDMSSKYLGDTFMSVRNSSRQLNL